MPRHNYPSKRKQRTLAERFWEKVNKNGPVPKHRPSLGKCWIFTACTDAAGYGQIGNGIDSGHIKAHHASWILTKGPIPEGKWILHRCDNPTCVRPSHLFTGNHDDNMRDCKKKGRQQHGETHYAAKLTAEQVQEIRKLWETRLYRQWEIAEIFGVSQGHVSEIANSVKRLHG
jgi:predicted XRE-type DNA-binding protein